MDFRPRHIYPDLYDVVLGLEADTHWIVTANDSQEALTGIGYLLESVDGIIEYTNDARVALLPKPNYITPDMQPCTRKLYAALRRALDAEVAPTAAESLNLLREARSHIASAFLSLDIAIEAVSKDIP